jgi:hypothetical protein
LRERMARAPSTHSPTDCPEPYGLEHPRLSLKDGHVGSDRSPRTVAEAVLAPVPSGQGGILPTDGLQLLAVPQAFPRAWRVKLRPPAVVLIIFMGTPWEVGDTVRPDQLSIND